MTFTENQESPDYEFTGIQNDQFIKLARMMRWVGIVFGISGGLTILVAFNPFSVVGLLQGAALAVIGYSLINAAISFKKIAITQGCDIQNLMKAIHQLYNACAIQLWSVVAVVIVALLSLFVL